MHTRKRHSELYHELNQKFHTFDRYRSQSSAKVRVLLLLPLTTPPYSWNLRGVPLTWRCGGSGTYIPEVLLDEALRTCCLPPAQFTCLDNFSFTKGLPA